MDPLAQNITGTAGTGAAALTTGHDFDVLDPQGIHWKNLEKKQAAQAAEKQERDAVLSSIDKLAGTGWYPHREWINTRVDELRKHATEAYQRGQDPTRGELGEKMANLKREINEGVETSQYLKGMYGDMRKLIDKDPDKYELESFKKIENSLYDIDGVMSGRVPIENLRTKKEKSSLYNAYKDLKPTLKSSSIEKGDVTTESKNLNTRSNITQAATAISHMDDVTDIALRYKPDGEIQNIKKYAPYMDLIEAKADKFDEMYEARGEENPLTRNQTINAIIEATDFIESKGVTEYSRKEDEAKSGWSNRGFTGDDININKGGEKGYNIKTAKGKDINAHAFDSYSLGGKRMDKSIKLDATKFIDMNTGEAVREGDVLDEKGNIKKLGNKVIGDKDISVTDLMLLPVDGNGKVVAKGKEKATESLKAGTVKLKWFAQGTMYDTEITPPAQLKGKPTVTKTEKNVLIPYEDIKNKLKSSYGFDLDERTEDNISNAESGIDEFSDILGDNKIDY